jgi:hypothetical protein
MESRFRATEKNVLKPIYIYIYIYIIIYLFTNVTKCIIGKKGKGHPCTGTEALCRP